MDVCGTFKDCNSELQISVNSLELSEIDINTSIEKFLKNYWTVKPVKDAKNTYHTVGYYRRCNCGFRIPNKQKFPD
uniref:Uncharacterized protein n=1 Tax=Panagrolaimus superbus TaxID=310955 RepID=A0A914YZY9_9BILA